ncbi:hypothetical protein [Paraburkholderia adhaesiva]|uniref:hypothetical protein n=1 Tax=Paraburkholderia adhaesiva TaxID=2883244 RepID=UPI001F24A28D|nr:hypothetical protein [Paraburkholderia adhaesiva]
MQGITHAQSMPLLVLAYRLYQDVSRYSGLLEQFDPINPCFAPASFSVPVA